MVSMGKDRGSRRLIQLDAAFVCLWADEVKPESFAKVRREGFNCYLIIVGIL